MHNKCRIVFILFLSILLQACTTTAITTSSQNSASEDMDPDYVAFQESMNKIMEDYRAGMLSSNYAGLTPDYICAHLKTITTISYNFTASSNFIYYVSENNTFVNYKTEKQGRYLVGDTGAVMYGGTHVKTTMMEDEEEGYYTLSETYNYYDKYTLAEDAFTFDYVRPNYFYRTISGQYLEYVSDKYEKDLIFLDTQTYLNFQSISCDAAFCVEMDDHSWSITGGYMYEDYDDLVYQFILRLDQDYNPIFFDVLYDVRNEDFRDITSHAVVYDHIRYDFNPVMQEPGVPLNVAQEAMGRGYVIAEFEHGVVTSSVDQDIMLTSYTHNGKPVTPISDVWSIIGLFYDDINVGEDAVADKKVTWYLPEGTDTSKLHVYGYYYPSASDTTEVDEYEWTTSALGIEIESFKDVHMFLSYD